MKNKIVLALCAFTVTSVLLVGCGSSSDQGSTEQPTITEEAPAEDAAGEVTPEPTEIPDADADQNAEAADSTEDVEATENAETAEDTEENASPENAESTEDAENAEATEDAETAEDTE